MLTIKKWLSGGAVFWQWLFFQCLEGAAEAVDQLYKTLLKDTRHKDLKVLSRKPIDVLSFSNWSMKHVPLEDEMTKLLKSKGFKTFDPYNFNAEMTKNAMELLHSSNDSTQAALLEDVNKQAIQPEKQLTQQPALVENNKKLMQYVVIALVVLIIFLMFLNAS